MYGVTGLLGRSGAPMEMDGIGGSPTTGVVHKFFAAAFCAEKRKLPEKRNETLVADIMRKRNQ